MSDAPILFFDGDCGMCHCVVRWIDRHDHRRVLRFAPLQGATYAALEHPDKPTDLSTIVLSRGGRIHLRSAAIVRALGVMGGAWPIVAALAWLVPGPLRDAAYRWVSRRRKQIFGGSCPLTEPSLQPRLLA